MCKVNKMKISKFREFSFSLSSNVSVVTIVVGFLIYGVVGRGVVGSLQSVVDPCGIIFASLSFLLHFSEHGFDFELCHQQIGSLRI